jgi:hypothetical protein
MCLISNFYYPKCGHTTRVAIKCDYADCAIAPREKDIEGMFCELCMVEGTYQLIPPASCIAPDATESSKWTELFDRPDSVRNNDFIRKLVKIREMDINHSPRGASRAQPAECRFTIQSLVEYALNKKHYGTLKVAATVLQQWFLQKYVCLREPRSFVEKQLLCLTKLHKSLLAATVINDERRDVIWKFGAPNAPDANNVFYRDQNDVCVACDAINQQSDDQGCHRCRAWYQWPATYRNHAEIRLWFINDDIEPPNFLTLSVLNWIPEHHGLNAV